MAFNLFVEANTEGFFRLGFPLLGGITSHIHDIYDKLLNAAIEVASCQKANQYRDDEKHLSKSVNTGDRGGERGVDNGMGPLPKSPAGLQLAKSGAAVGNCPGRKR